jgi:hypothetical protein
MTITLEEKMFWISKAIRHLDPASEFTMSEDNLDTLVFIKLTGDEPTHQQINETIPIVKDLEQQKKTDAAAQKQALLAKLGITAEEAQLLLGGN